jgi:hypothetical protein
MRTYASSCRSLAFKGKSEKDSEQRALRWRCQCSEKEKQGSVWRNAYREDGGVFRTGENYIVPVDLKMGSFGDAVRFWFSGNNGVKIRRDY